VENLLAWCHFCGEAAKICTGQDEGEMKIFTAKEQRGKEAGGSLFSLRLCTFASLQ
jgi:hypothetical protein